VPRAADENNPHRWIVTVALEQGDEARATRALEALLQVDARRSRRKGRACPASGW
jgi:hypothetical protein